LELAQTRLLESNHMVVNQISPKLIQGPFKANS
jgi:hypothetical protein